MACLPWLKSRRERRQKKLKALKEKEEAASAVLPWTFDEREAQDQAEWDTVSRWTSDSTRSCPGLKPRNIFYDRKKYEVSTRGSEEQDSIPKCMAAVDLNAPMGAGEFLLEIISFYCEL